MKYIWKQDAIKHAQQCDPEESCGIVWIKNKKVDVNVWLDSESRKITMQTGLSTTIKTNKDGLVALFRQKKKG